MKHPEMMTADLPQVSVVGEARLAEQKAPPLRFDDSGVRDVPSKIITVAPELQRVTAERNSGPAGPELGRTGTLSRSDPSGRRPTPAWTASRGRRTTPQWRS